VFKGTGKNAVDRAIFGIVRINVLAPPLPLLFGKINTRPLDIKARDRLVASYRSNDVWRYNSKVMLPVSIQRKHVAPECHTTNIGRLSEAPMLKLTKDGMAELETIVMVGGNHRVEALRVFAAGIKKTWQKADQKFNRAVGENASENVLAKLKAKAVEAQQEWDEVGLWSAALYDDGT
jgi:hypothetical protein